MEYVIVSSVAEKLELVIDDTMTVGEVRGVIQAMLDAPDEAEVTMVVNGCTVSDEEALWSDAMTRCFAGKQPSARTKIYCRVGGKRKVEMDSEVMRFALPSKETKDEELNAERERARMMEPMIEEMAKNPAFVENMMRMQPGLKEMMDANPEVARQLKNPDVLKDLMMSQLHPDRRREMGRNLDLQLAQLSAIPGGQQMLDRYTHGMDEDLERAGYGKQSADDLHETAEEVARPQAGRTSNAEALPNPWQSSAQPTGGPTMPAGFPSPWQHNPFNFFPTPTPGPAGTGGAGAFQPWMNPGMMPSFMMGGTAGAAGTSAASATPLVAPQEPDYSSQMAVLRDMGFEDASLNMKALKDASGDVEAAVLLLAEQADPDDENADHSPNE